MAEYLLYCFDGYKLERCDRFDADDDDAAAAEALRRHEGKAAELWCDNRKVTDFPALHLDERPGDEAGQL